MGPGRTLQPSERLANLVRLALAVAVLVTFAPASRNQFVNYDDRTYVLHNAHVQAGRLDLQWAFGTFEAANWHPLTWLSLVLDGALYHREPFGFHLTNIFLHLANTLLALELFRRLTGSFWLGAFVAGLFALHPLHVESVAWAAERKDVLSGLFFFLTLLSYLGYADEPGVGRYLMTVLFFVLGLLAKPMLVTVPGILLLLDVWPLRRFAGAQLKWPLVRWAHGKWRTSFACVTEKLPFMAISVASGMQTLIAQRHGEALQTLDMLPFSGRLANAVMACWGYLGKMIWPIHLCAFYPMASSPGVGQVALAGVGLLSITAAALSLARSRPYFLAGWGWYLVMLTPVIGLVQVGSQAMADRYTYLPLLGIFWALACAGAELLATAGLPAGASGAIAVCLLAALGAGSYRQAGVWRDSITLWRHALSMTHENCVAHTNLADALLEEVRAEAPSRTPEGRGAEAARRNQQILAEAIAQCRVALRIKPEGWLMHYNLGVALARAGQTEEAAHEFREAVSRNDESAAAHLNLGLAEATLGRRKPAIEHLRRSLELSPGYPTADRQLGRLLVETGDVSGGEKHLAAAAHQNPNDAVAYSSLGMVLAMQMKYAEAAIAFRQAHQLEPEQPEHLFDLAFVQAELQDAAASRSNYQRALSRMPELLETSAQRAWVMAASPDAEQRHGRMALLLARQCYDAPDNARQPQYIDLLAAAEAEVGLFADAVAHEKRALEIAQSSSQSETTIAAMRMRLELFEKHQPYRSPVGTGG